MATEMKCAEPEACNLPKRVISEIAESLAAKWNYACNGDVEPIVEALGGKITYQSFWDLEDSTSGSIQIESAGSFQIFLSKHTTSERDRFTICHELGHYVLHYLIKDPKPSQMMRAARYGDGRTELEANWFAASFLMPENQFKAVYSEFSGDLSLVAEKFGVSVSAVTVRAKSLSLNATL